MNLNETQTIFATTSMTEMGKLMAMATSSAKSAKKSKKASDHATIVAYAHNFATIAVCELVDEFYGVEGHRNNDTGPEYRELLQAAGFSEAKAKKFWEYGQLGFKSEALAGLSEAATDAKSVLKFLQGLDIDTEAKLKAVVQPKVEKTFQEKVLELVEKAGLDLPSAATELQGVLDLLEEKATSPEAVAKAEKAAKSQGMSAVLAALKAA